MHSTPPRPHSAPYTARLLRNERPGSFCVRRRVEMCTAARLKGNETIDFYWCPVNLYEHPYKRRVLGERIEGVASDGMPWKKNPPPWKKVPTAWKKVPTAACFYGPPHRRK